MTLKKIEFIAVQLLALLLVNYLLLVNEGFLYRGHWPISLCLALLYLHTIGFGTLYATFITKEFTPTKRKILVNLFGFGLVSFTALLCFHNCHVKSGNVVMDYGLGIGMIVLSLAFISEMRSNLLPKFLDLCTPYKLKI